MKYNSIVLYSGGIDSLITLEYVKQKLDKNTQPIFFNINSKYSNYEVNYVIDKNAIIDNSLDLGEIEQDDAYIPQRNILLATLAVAKYSKTIYIGGSMSDRVSDNNEIIFSKLSPVLSEVDGCFIDIISPFWNVYKDDMVNWYCGSVKEPQEKLIFDTFSCYTPSEFPTIQTYSFNNSEIGKETHECLSCKACFRKCCILYTAGIFVEFNNKDIISHYKKECEDIKLTDRRMIGTLKYINELERIQNGN